MLKVITGICRRSVTNLLHWHSPLRFSSASDTGLRGCGTMQLGFGSVISTIGGVEQSTVVDLFLKHDDGFTFQKNIHV